MKDTAAFFKEVTGGWISLHNEEFHNLYSSPNIKSRRMRWAGRVAHMGEVRNMCKIFVRKPEGKRRLGRPKCIWENNITMTLRGMVWEGVDWIHLAQDRDQWQALVNTVMNLQVP
jgi:hypothetical protein